MFELVVGVVRTFGYPGLLVLMFAENVFPPLPSEAVMPLGGFLVERGELQFLGVVAAGTIGSIFGSLPLYYLGRRIGVDRVRDWADRYGRWLALCGRDIDRACHWFDRYGGAAIVISRLLPGLRAFISLPAGARGMSVPLFMLCTGIGSALWAAILTYAGMLLGRNYAAVKDYLGHLGWGVLGVLILAFILHVLRHRSPAGERKPA